MSDEYIEIGNIRNMEYWCEPERIFQYLDIVVPFEGRKFPCPVCKGTQWGCPTVRIKKDDGPLKDVVTLVDFPVIQPGGKVFKMGDGDMPNYHYSLICLNCSHTLFLNAALVQSKIKSVAALRHE